MMGKHDMFSPYILLRKIGGTIGMRAIERSMGSGMEPQVHKTVEALIRS